MARPSIDTADVVSPRIRSVPTWRVGGTHRRSRVLIGLFLLALIVAAIAGTWHYLGDRARPIEPGRTLPVQQ